MNDDKPRVIYLLKHPLTGEARYVGVTLHNVQHRLSRHLYEAKAKNYHGNSRRAKWIRSLLAQGLLPVLEPYCSVIPRTRWQDLEIEIIAKFRAEGCRLVNGTAGGEGTTGRVWSPSVESRARMAAAQVGRKASDETKKKRSVTLKAFYANDPEAMKKRQEIARQAARSFNARKAASDRMRAIWSDPVLAAQWRERMRVPKSPRQNTV